MGEVSRLVAEEKTELALKSVRDVLESAWSHNRALALQNAELLRKIYGRSSERISPHQLALALEQIRAEHQSNADEPSSDENLPTDPPEPEPEPRKKSGEKRRKKRKGGRQPLPPELPRTIIRLVPDEAGESGMTKVGEKISEVLEFSPAQFIVKRYIRETWSS